MIPVQLQPEPPDFDIHVRRRGRQWLAKNGIKLDFPPPKASDLPPYWRYSSKQLWEAYQGVCAYLAIYFEWVTGASSTDHFIPKSRYAGGAYEWDNFRLSCIALNRDKGTWYILDPIGLNPDTFILNLSSGKIRPNPSLTGEDKTKALKTMTLLKLDCPENNLMRARHYSFYLHGDWSLEYLKHYSPFVHSEIIRQGLE